MSDRQDEPSRRTREQRMPPLGGNLLWLILAAAVATLFVASLFGGRQSEIGYMELVRLIEQGNPAKNPEAAIVVEEGSMGLTMSATRRVAGRCGSSFSFP